MPWGGSRAEDAIPHLEYRKAREEGERRVYSLSARNTHPTKTIVGEVRMTLETAARETKVLSKTFTLAPNETEKLIVYPEACRLSYEVTAAFKE